MAEAKHVVAGNLIVLFALDGAVLGVYECEQRSKATTQMTSATGAPMALELQRPAIIPDVDCSSSIKTQLASYMRKLSEEGLSSLGSMEEGLEACRSSPGHEDRIIRKVRAQALVRACIQADAGPDWYQLDLAVTDLGTCVECAGDRARRTMICKRVGSDLKASPP
jgi:hypothetical protein